MPVIENAWHCQSSVMNTPHMPATEGGRGDRGGNVIFYRYQYLWFPCQSKRLLPLSEAEMTVEYPPHTPAQTHTYCTYPPQNTLFLFSSVIEQCPWMILLQGAEYRKSN